MRRLITSLIAILAATNLGAQEQVPKLVVCITVDQLRGDYIQYFYHTFSERGFKRLMNEGVVYNNVRFEFANIDQASAFATLYTGTNPLLHGITGKNLYDFDKREEISILYDPDYLGNYTKDHYSPKNLVASTIGDELKIASKGRSDVFSIAPDAEAAIISAGHAADGAFWLDDLNGKWATTTYYKGLPWYVDRYNNGPESLSARLDQMVWTPALSLEQYKAFPYVMDEIPFRYTFNEKTVDCYPKLKTSPFINKEINRLASRFLEYGAFGSRPCPDFMAITYYGGNYVTLMEKEYTHEIQDLYYQLDKDLAELLDLIDKQVGLKQTLVVLTGSGYFRSEESYADGLMMNRGEFHPKRCEALLNMYLMAIYGQKSWVKGFYNNQIYLNRKTIEDEKLDLEVIQNKAAEFVAQFSGVQQVTTDYALKTGNWNEGTSAFRTGTHHLNRGDLIVELQPGWRISDDTDVKNRTKIVRHNAVLTPLIFLGNGLKPQHIYREIKATEIAPSVTHILRIRPPNASQSLPLYELTK